MRVLMVRDELVPLAIPRHPLPRIRPQLAGRVTVAGLAIGIGIDQPELVHTLLHGPPPRATKTDSYYPRRYRLQHLIEMFSRRHPFHHDAVGVESHSPHLTDNLMVIGVVSDHLRPFQVEGDPL